MVSCSLAPGIDPRSFYSFTVTLTSPPLLVGFIVLLSLRCPITSLLKKPFLDLLSIVQQCCDDSDLFMWLFRLRLLHRAPVCSRQSMGENVLINHSWIQTLFIYTLFLIHINIYFQPGFIIYSSFNNHSSSTPTYTSHLDPSNFQLSTITLHPHQHLPPHLDSRGGDGGGEGERNEARGEKEGRSAGEQHLQPTAETDEQAGDHADAVCICGHIYWELLETND